MKFKLSRSAINISKHFSETHYPSQEIKRISQIIGQYAGTDIYHTPGDLYVRKRVIKRVYIKIIPFSRDMMPNTMEFTVEEYSIYNVISRTPCTIRCAPIYKLYVFDKNPRHSYYQRRYPDEIRDREYTFHLKQTPIFFPSALRTFRPDMRLSSEVEHELHDLNIDMSTLPNIVMNVFGHSNVAFDYATQCLIVRTDVDVPRDSEWLSF